MNPTELSKKDLLASLQYEDQQAFLKDITEEEAEYLLYDWDFNGRPKPLH